MKKKESVKSTGQDEDQQRNFVMAGTGKVESFAPRENFAWAPTTAGVLLYAHTRLNQSRKSRRADLNENRQFLLVSETAL